MKLTTTLVAAAMYAAGGALAYAQDSEKDTPIGVIFAAGDIATCSKNATRNGTTTANLILNQIDETHKKYPGLPVRILALGDIAYREGEPENFHCFGKTWGVKFKNRLLPVPGNHDYGTDHGKPYFKFFNATAKAIEKADKELGKHAGSGFYAVKFPDAAGQWLLIGLNSNIGKSAQIKWLNTILEKNKAPCVLAFSHAFFYSSGRHGHADAKGRAQNSKIDLNGRLRPESVMQGLFKTLVAHHASVMLAGHDHHFEQLGPANAKANPKDFGQSAMTDDGVRSFIVGTGGTRLHENDYKYKWAFTEAYDLHHYGILKMMLFADGYSWSFVPTGAHPKSLETIKTVSRAKCNRPS